MVHYNRSPITTSDMSGSNVSRQYLYSGLVRLHILHHASREPIFGLGMIEELGRHGYRLSPGTLYPIMHGLEKKGLLRSKEHMVGGKIRRVYLATPSGRKALESAKERVRELFGELFED
jgi:PadR family transcriptional regulator PadR